MVCHLNKSLENKKLSGVVESELGFGVLRREEEQDQDNASRLPLTKKPPCEGNRNITWAELYAKEQKYNWKWPEKNRIYSLGILPQIS